MKLKRGWWVAFVLAPVAVLGDASVAQADEPAADEAPLPAGVHLDRNGRYWADVCDHAEARYCLSHRLLPESYRPGDSTDGVPFAGASASAMQPKDVLAGYSIPAGASAGGKIVAILDSNDNFAAADVNTYRAQYGIKALPVCPGSGLPDPKGGTPCFAKVDQSGGSINMNIGDGKTGDVETGLDMDMISAACPDCSILLVQLKALTDADFIAAVATAAKLGAVATSISIGGPESKSNPATGYTTAGHLVLAASGDDGYNFDLKKGYPATPSYPASATDVVSVGGTCLTLSGTTYTEDVWDLGAAGGATTSGCSTIFARPAYQTAFGASKFGSCTKRAANDVSAAGCFYPSVSAKEGAINSYSTDYGWQPVNGTSASSPIVAAIFTRLGLTDAIAADFGFMYTHIADFNDVIKGTDSSTTCSDVMCSAGAGWDGPTGVGTPNGEKLMKAGSSSSSGGGSGSSSGKGGGKDGGGSGSGSSSGGKGGSGSSGGKSGSSSGSGEADAAAQVDAQAPASDSGINNDLGGGSSSGCGCFVAPSGPEQTTGVLALGGLALVLSARRRRR